jgi:hypothetical protein
MPLPLFILHFFILRSKGFCPEVREGGKNKSMKGLNSSWNTNYKTLARKSKFRECLVAENPLSSIIVDVRSRLFRYMRLQIPERRLDDKIKCVFGLLTSRHKEEAKVVKEAINTMKKEVAMLLVEKHTYVLCSQEPCPFKRGLKEVNDTAAAKKHDDLLAAIGSFRKNMFDVDKLLECHVAFESYLISNIDKICSSHYSSFSSYLGTKVDNSSRDVTVFDPFHTSASYRSVTGLLMLRASGTNGSKYEKFEAKARQKPEYDPSHSVASRTSGYTSSFFEARARSSKHEKASFFEARAGSMNGSSFGASVLRTPDQSDHFESDRLCARVAKVAGSSAVLSEDFDCVALFGADMLVKEVWPRFFTYTMLTDVMDAFCSKSRNELIKKCCILGTDYNHGIKNVGPVKIKKIDENKTSTLFETCLALQSISIRDLVEFFLNDEAHVL